jgi:hypothetical protein
MEAFALQFVDRRRVSLAERHSTPVRVRHLDHDLISRLLESEGSSLVEPSSTTKMIFVVLTFSPAWQDSPKIDPSHINSTPVAGDAQPSSL